MTEIDRIVSFIDHTLLAADATKSMVERLCAEARHHGFHAVCVHGTWITLARALLEESDVKVVTVAGFPLGGMDGDAKRYETEVAVDNGAQEIDVVMNLGRFKSGDDGAVLRELRDVVEAADERPVKVILETGYLDRDEVVRACSLVLESGARFVKTSTGFGPRGATVDDVRLLRETVGDRIGVKASGGIRDHTTASAMIAAGATRLGTSAGVAIAEAFGTGR